MSSPREQLGDGRRWVVIRNGGWIKRQYAKWRRRQEKRDPEGAPKRPSYRGGVA